MKKLAKAILIGTSVTLLGTTAVLGAATGTSPDNVVSAETEAGSLDSSSSLQNRYGSTFHCRNGMDKHEDCHYYNAHKAESGFACSSHHNCR